MTRRSINNWIIGNILPIVDEDRPDIYRNKESDVGELVEGKDKWEDVVRNGLCKPIKGMKSMTRIRSRYDPFMVWLMQYLIDHRMMQSSMNPINPEIREKQEKREL